MIIFHSHKTVIEIFRLFVLNLLENGFLMGDLRLCFTELNVSLINLLIYALAWAIWNLVHWFSVANYRVLRLIKFIAVLIIIMQNGEIWFGNLLCGLIFFADLGLHVYYRFADDLLTGENHNAASWFCTHKFFNRFQLTVLKINNLLLVLTVYAGIIVELATRANLYYITLVKGWQILVSDLIHSWTYGRLAS